MHSNQQALEQFYEFPMKHVKIGPSDGQHLEHYSCMTEKMSLKCFNKKHIMENRIFFAFLQSLVHATHF